MLQGGNPEKITVEGATQLADEHSLNPVNPVEMERRLHVLLGHHRLVGEWFDAPFERIVMAWKVAWTSLANPPVIERYNRLIAAREKPPAKVIGLSRAAIARANQTEPAPESYRYRDPEARLSKRADAQEAGCQDTMKQRGRVSAQALATPVKIDASQAERPDAPYDLTDKQAEEWWAVVNRMPADWFPRE